MTPSKREPEPELGYSVHSGRDGAFVCGPFDEATAERERERLEEEARENRRENPISPTTGANLFAAGNPERDAIRELAIRTGNADLAERIPDLGAAAAEDRRDPGEVLEPTSYHVREVVVPPPPEEEG